MKKLLKLLRIFVGHLDSRLAVRSPIWLIMSDIFNYCFCAGTLCKVTNNQRIIQFFQLIICNKKYFVFIWNESHLLTILTKKLPNF